jgi:hypothetical protein
MHPAFGVAGSSHVFRAPNSEEIKRRSRVFSTNLTMANAYTDRSSLDLKSDFAAIAATRPLLHLELLSPSFALLFETKPASRGIGQPDRAPPTRSLTFAKSLSDRLSRSGGGLRADDIGLAMNPILLNSARPRPAILLHVDLGPNTSSGYRPVRTLWSFNGSDGANPQASLLIDGNGDLFGTTGSGTLFEIPNSSSKE